MALRLLCLIFVRAPGLAGPAWPPREREAWPDYTKIIDEQHRA
jgi:hypothetical protein